MEHMQLRDQAMTLCSDLVTPNLGRLITTIFICVAVIVANSCKTQKGVEGSIAMGKEFSQSDFQKLRWLEGAWRGSDGGKGAFWGSGRNFDFCYGSGIEMWPLAKIKGIIVASLFIAVQKGEENSGANCYRD